MSLAALLLSACRTTRQTQNVHLKPRTDEYLMEHLVKSQVSADWFGGKAKITYSDDDGRESFTANIRMQKDSVIWMNFKKFSVEGLRVLIRPDSIFILDRLNSEYLARPFEYARQEFSLPMGFQGLQAILLGNPVFFSNQTSASIDSTFYLLSQKTERLEAKYWLDGAKLLLDRFFFNDFRNSRSMDVRATDYRSVGGRQSFSYVRSFDLDSSDMGRMNVQIEFSKIELNVPQKIEFTIPAHYEKVD